MTRVPNPFPRIFLSCRPLAGALLVAAALLTAAPAAARSSIPAFAQAVAEAAVDEAPIAEFYRDTGYRAIWTGTGAGDRARRQALLTALAGAGIHGLPVARYGLERLKADLRQVSSPRELGRLEVEMSRLFVLYARQISSGILEPRAVVSGIERDPARPDPGALLAAIAEAAQPAVFLRELAPGAPEYVRLLAEKLRLERVLARGGWGPRVPAGALGPGQSGAAVVALRDRLMALGYLGRSASRSYDAAIEDAVRDFQADMGLEPTGAANPATMRQINMPVEKRLASILVALERERWTNFERGKRHIWVNLTDFSAKIVDDGKVTFETRSVVGKNVPDQRSPEFSDEMEYMEINPYWNVPRSIATKEYLPSMLRDPGSVAHLQLIDGAGRVVPRSAVDFSRYTPSNFPFNLRQAPSPRNALGLVKFMFPNQYAIYLHDTPAKSLFNREKRDFSHGCIRLQEPFEFAYRLLAPQDSDPVGSFQSALRSGKNIRIDLTPHVPVHLVYRTAIMPAAGKAQYRNDVYGRDARIFEALTAAGVTLGVAQG